MRFGGLVISALLVCAAAPALAQEPPPYLDDRSSPQALVRSLYNAVNRKEYARAWSYFAAKPAADLTAYADGYTATQSVNLVVGTPATEGAAGSTYSTLPVAIAAEDTGGNLAVFAGCYVVRLANPDVQGDDFQPLSIEKATLSPAQVPVEKALPTSCPDVPQLPTQNAALEKARAKFLGSRMGECTVEEGSDPQTWELPFNYAHDAENEPKRIATLISFFCSRGAYNETRVFYLGDDTGEVKPLSFPEPELDIRYVDDQSEKLDSMTVIGFTAAQGLVNADYDPDTFTLTSFSKWRGVGDAASVGTYIFRNGEFTLVKFEVDPTFDGESELKAVYDTELTP